MINFSLEFKKYILSTSSLFLLVILYILINTINNNSYSNTIINYKYIYIYFIILIVIVIFFSFLRFYNFTDKKYKIFDRTFAIILITSTILYLFYSSNINYIHILLLLGIIISYVLAHISNKSTLLHLLFRFLGFLLLYITFAPNITICEIVGLIILYVLYLLGSYYYCLLNKDTFVCNKYYKDGLFIVIVIFVIIIRVIKQ